MGFVVKFWAEVQGVLHGEGFRCLDPEHLALGSVWQRNSPRGHYRTS